MTDTIKTRPDGSIDTAHYMHIGRIARSQAAHDMVKNRKAPNCQAPKRQGWLSLSWLLPRTA